MAIAMLHGELPGGEYARQLLPSLYSPLDRAAVKSLSIGRVRVRVMGEGNLLDGTCRGFVCSQNMSVFHRGNAEP
jgi:hypothetical protein